MTNQELIPVFTGTLNHQATQMVDAAQEEEDHIIEIEGRRVKRTGYFRTEDTRFGEDSWELFFIVEGKREGSFAAYGGSAMEVHGWCSVSNYKTIQEAIEDGFLKE